MLLIMRAVRNERKYAADRVQNKASPTFPSTSIRSSQTLEIGSEEEIGTRQRVKPLEKGNDSRVAENQRSASPRFLMLTSLPLSSAIRLTQSG